MVSAAPRATVQQQQKHSATDARMLVFRATADDLIPRRKWPCVCARRAVSMLSLEGAVKYGFSQQEGGKNSRNSLSYWFGEGYFASIFTTKIT